MNKIVKPKEFIQSILDALDETVTELYPEEEREEAKARILAAMCGTTVTYVNGDENESA